MSKRNTCEPDLLNVAFIAVRGLIHPSIPVLLTGIIYIGLVDIEVFLPFYSRLVPDIGSESRATLVEGKGMAEVLDGIVD
jgi:hypothetical protein